jgi:hypothetical protein
MGWLGWGGGTKTTNEITEDESGIQNSDETELVNWDFSPVNATDTLDDLWPRLRNCT